MGLWLSPLPVCDSYKHQVKLLPQRDQVFTLCIVMLFSGGTLMYTVSWTAFNNDSMINDDSIECFNELHPIISQML